MTRFAPFALAATLALFAVAAPASAQDKMSNDAMASDKMGHDAMASDKMGHDAMASDKMSHDAMATHAKKPAKKVAARTTAKKKPK